MSSSASSCFSVTGGKKATTVGPRTTMVFCAGADGAADMPRRISGIARWFITLLVVSPGAAGVLHVLIEPGHLFPDHMFGGFLGPVAVGFERQEDQTHGAAVAADGLVHAFGLDRERAIVIVGFAVN